MTKCSEHPDAPHGFDRNASHAAGDYVCDCESWEPPDYRELLKKVLADEEYLEVPPVYTHEDKRVLHILLEENKREQEYEHE